MEMVTENPTMAMAIASTYTRWKRLVSGLAGGSSLKSQGDFNSRAETVQVNTQNGVGGGERNAGGGAERGGAECGGGARNAGGWPRNAGSGIISRCNASNASQCNVQCKGTSRFLVAARRALLLPTSFAGPCCGATFCGIGYLCGSGAEVFIAG